ncbi:MAG: hypothetical protein HKN47_05995 [Pirellulaceae bacterium]|nr:hypothetical protein [Pirellulaceae bacterium]
MNVLSLHAGKYSLLNRQLGTVFANEFNQSSSQLEESCHDNDVFNERKQALEDECFPMNRQQTDCQF